ncbi:MAG: rod shape-determining protein RodA [Clostridium sp.]
MLEKLKINRKVLRELDVITLITLITIVVFGALNIASVSGVAEFKKQMIFLGISLVMVYFILLFDYSMLLNYTDIFYWGCIFFLILNDFTPLGHMVNGAKSWVKIGSIQFQPSEFAKIAMIFMLGKKLQEMEGHINEPKNFFTLCFYAAIPMVLIVIQPDMGMTMVSFFIVLGIFFASGLDLRIILGGLGTLVLSVVILWQTPIMQKYWKVRLLSFLNPAKFSQGATFQLVQSQISIGSGGIFGMGMFNIKQANFVPEARTDFIFSVVGEQFGLIGAIFLLTLYGIVIYRFIKIAQTSKDIFGSVITIGMTSVLLFSIFQNIGMTVGIMPVTGITLPLMSAGGSSLITNLMTFGLVLNVGMRRKRINF